MFVLSYGAKCFVQRWDFVHQVMKLSDIYGKSKSSTYVQLKILHSKWTVVLQLDWSVFQWTLCARYFTACGQWYCSLNGVCFSEHYVEDNSQHVDSGIAAWMECVTVNIMWKTLHSMWTVVLLLEWSALQLLSSKTEEHEDWTNMPNWLFLYNLNWTMLRWLKWRKHIWIGNVRF